ncbi:MAG: hypothetical protein ACTHLN_11060 [Tepidisphaeraceae bacterium]
MNQAWSLLAAEDPVLKLVIGLVVAGIWVVLQIAGAMSKKPDKRRPPSTLQLPPRTMEPPARRHPDLPGPRRGVLTQSGRPAPTVRNRPDVRPPLVKPPPVMRAPVKAPPLPQPVRAMPPAPTAARPAPVVRRPAVAPTPAAVTKAPAAAATDRLPRKQFLDALLKPRNLRKAYLLAEILQPPVALRDSRRVLP